MGHGVQFYLEPDGTVGHQNQAGQGFCGSTRQWRCTTFREVRTDPTFSKISGWCCWTRGMPLPMKIGITWMVLEPRESAGFNRGCCVFAGQLVNFADELIRFEWFL